jgi:hypothetical protein
MGARVLVVGIAVGAMLLGTSLAAISALVAADEPIVDHQPVECSVPEKNPRICAYVLDDGEVKRVRVYFRSDRQDAYYWSEMAFDGIQFCATLPVAKGYVEAIDYYVWSVDDEFQTTRTRPHEISMRQSSSCSYPVIDEDPERIKSLVINATSAKQGDEVKDFEDQGIRQFVPAKKR